MKIANFKIILKKVKDISDLQLTIKYYNSIQRLKILKNQWLWEKASISGNAKVSHLCAGIMNADKSFFFSGHSCLWKVRLMPIKS